jgi:hypothetical protein
MRAGRPHGKISARAIEPTGIVYNGASVKDQGWITSRPRLH